MTPQKRGDPAHLQARIEDYLEQSERGTVAVSRFLTPSERKQAERYLTQKGVGGRCLFWGGYEDAERTCLIVFPSYYEDLSEWLPQDGNGISEILDSLGGDTVTAVRVTGSGYRKLSHRDYLGSLLGLGLERDALGDVAVQNDREAVVFCQKRMAVFLTEALEKVANDVVKCAEWRLDKTFTDGKCYTPVHDTVASARLDCVVAALTNLSREDAQTAVRSGLVELDFEAEERVDRLLTAPATISVRGHGRFVLRSFDGETKKGRIRMRADRLV